MDGSGMAGTVTVWSEFAAAPALAPVGRCRRCQCRAARRRACAIGSGESAARVLLAALRTAFQDAPTHTWTEIPESFFDLAMLDRARAASDRHSTR